jgi:hypothetical protein
VESLKSHEFPHAEGQLKLQRPLRIAPVFPQQRGDPPEPLVQGVGVDMELSAGASVVLGLLQVGGQGLGEFPSAVLRVLEQRREWARRRTARSSELGDSRACASSA